MSVFAVLLLWHTRGKELEMTLSASAELRPIAFHSFVWTMPYRCPLVPSCISQTRRAVQI